MSLISSILPSHFPTSLQIKSLIHTLYIFAIISVLLAKYNRKLNGFLRYGKTLSNVSPPVSSSSSINGDHVSSKEEQGTDDYEISHLDIIEKLISLRVPKLWFFHFYLLSFFLSLLGFLILHLNLEYGFSPPEILIREINDPERQSLVSCDVARVVFFLILGHSTRRLVETLFIMRYGRGSKMNISHYFVGIFFYTSINLLLLLSTDFQEPETLTEKDQGEIFDPVLFGSCILFFLASLDQFMNHIHLSNIVKYNLPKFGFFKYICCAHYFDEILMYLSIFAAIRNFSFALVLLWVVINLSVSAIESREFYKRRDILGKVPKWSIIPCIV
ncbi:hypothetical protein WICPIJ_003295 [Wickerhamomyces pijperi]|uniref:Polyprenal reductase n=1 Tax=Wickerhamomyces pijperi TaxID=599730 RepID=A0A9P8TPD6_WICPI|nr:hypothetical protein WICPIJ_003295 [Wickerhamomyces pijperi]